jgi:hypothetical protein
MPPAYNVSSKYFDELMAAVCPFPRRQVFERVDQVARRWELEDQESERREISRAFLVPGKDKA